MENVSTTELDNLLKQIQELRADYDAKKKISSEAYGKLEELENQFIELMVQADKTQWRVEGIGVASVVTKLSVKTPKTLDAKKDFFDYMRERFGYDVVMEKFSMNSQSLNSFYNEEYSSCADKALFHIPGIEAPVATREFRLRKG